ncbi:MAG: 2-C-methyl-D-erythritol 4-phosphate cytidylyltransferase [Bacillota bacterium]
MSDPVWVVIPAGGLGVRAGFPLPKQFCDLNGVSVLERTVRQVMLVPEVAGIVIALPSGESGQAGHPKVAEIRDRLLNLAGPSLRVVLVDGGTTRQESVRLALQHVPPEVGVVAVHDASRPFVSPDLFKQVVEAACRFGAAICGIRPTDTIKAVRASGAAGGTEGTVLHTLDRDSLVSVQTPQVFAAATLRKAHEAALRDSFIGTDDSSLVERLGVSVAVVAGERSNVKITFAEDFRSAVTQVTGLGFDIHPMAPGRRFILGGVDIPSELGLVGHSDADVLVHAVMDAILGALGKGDIGQWFPDSDPRYEGASSIKLMGDMWGRLSAAASVVNIDSVVIAEAPRIMPHAAEIRKNIAAALGCDPEQVSVKATTAERLGALGRKEGVAAYCVATLVKNT